MAVNYKPEGCQDAIPYLVVKDAKGLIEFLKHTFDVKTVGDMHTDGDKIVHAEVMLGDTMIMMGEASEEFKPMPAMLNVYVKDVDTVYKKGLEAGATSVRELADQFYGDRSGGLVDKWGNQWWISTHIEDVSPEEMDRRVKEFMENQT